MDEEHKHDWVLAGGSAASDGWACRSCEMRIETWAEDGPPPEDYTPDKYPDLALVRRAGSA